MAREDKHHDDVNNKTNAKEHARQQYPSTPGLNRSKPSPVLPSSSLSYAKCL